MTKKDGVLKGRLKARIDEMKADKPINDIEYIGDLKGKWKARVGDYRMPYAYCEDCKLEHYERFNECFGCGSKSNNTIVFFDAFHRSKGYDE